MKLVRLALCAAALTAVASSAVAQTVRFHTNVGSFDMVLNPTGLADLQPHVENMLRYVDAGRYHASTINRAPEGFVLQMGSFLTDTLTGVDSPSQYNPLRAFDDVIVDENGDGQVDFDLGGLTNIRGTVSLALAGGDPNTGGSSFFINIGDSSFLDSQGFVPFATISDMTVVDQIMALEQQSLDPSLTFSDVPFLDDGSVVVITDTEVITSSTIPLNGPIGPAASTAAFDAMMASASAPASVASAVSTPEPSTAALLLAGGLLGIGRRRR